MNNEVIKSYLVALGFAINHAQLSKFNDTLRYAGDRVSQFTGGTTAMFVRMATNVVGALTSITTGTLALMEHTAQADLGYQIFARRMFMSADAAKQLKIATDALGYSLEDIIWGPPELRERYQQLIADQKQLMAGLGGGDFETQMRRIRDIRFELTRFGVEVQYFSMSLAKALSKSLFGSESGLLDKFKSWNAWLIKNIPQLAEKLSTFLVPVMRDTYAILKDIGDIAGIVVSNILKFMGAFYDDQKLRTGAVNMENIGLALRHIADSTRAFFDELDRLVRLIDRHPDISRLLLGGVGGAAVGGMLAGPAGILPGAAFGLGIAGGSLAGEGEKWTPSGTAALRNYAAMIARKHGIDPALMQAIIDRESNWNPMAVNPESGAMGLMQVMPGNAHLYGQDASNMRGNLEIGAQLLADALRRHNGDVRGALKDYGGFVTKDPSAYQDYVLKHAEEYRRQEGKVDIGPVNIHINQPHATPEQISLAVRDGVSDALKKRTQNNLVQLNGVYA